MPIDTKAIRASLNGDWVGSTPVEKRLVALLEVVLAELERSNEEVSAQLAANTAKAQEVANLALAMHQRMEEVLEEVRLIAASADSARRSAEHAEREARAIEELLSETQRAERLERKTPTEGYRAYSSKPPSEPT